VGVPEWMQCAARIGAEAEAAMNKRGGAGKNVGGPRGRKPTPAADLDESAVMMLHQVADYLHCSRVTAYRLARQGEIPSFRFGGGWRFLKSEVDKWIAKGSGLARS
jgi:excisionase family DNA binding protein